MAGYLRIINLQNRPELDEDDDLIYVDRTNKILGNKHILKNKLNLDERLKVIQEYKQDLENDIANNGDMSKAIKKIAEDVKKGKNVCLGCWCSPLPCHGEVIAEKVQELCEDQVYYPVKHQIKKTKP